MKILSLNSLYTQRLGSYLAKFIKRKDIITLTGTLGAGKTILVKGVAKGLGFSSKKVVSSSFMLMRKYQTRKIPIYHFDFYRIENNKQVYDLGIDEYLEKDGVCLIEWADRAGKLLSHDCLEIKIDIATDTFRVLHFIAHGSRYKKLLKQLGTFLP